MPSGMGSRSFRTLLAAVKQLTLKPVKSITCSFDPYHNNVTSIREAFFTLKTEKVIMTNPSCRTKVEMKSDRSEPCVNVVFDDGQKMIIKTSNLTTSDIIQQLGEVCVEKAPPVIEEVETPQATTTKKMKLKKK